MRLIREFAVVYILWIVYVSCIEQTSPTLTRKCQTLSKDSCDLCLDSGLNHTDHAKFFSDTYAPAHCTSGNIEWHYPYGNGRVHFPINITGRETVNICMRSRGRSSKLIFHDITDEDKLFLSNSCTKKYRVSGEVVVHVSGIGGEFTPVGVGKDNAYLQRADYTINTYHHEPNGNCDILSMNLFYMFMSVILTSFC